jgi:phytoene synthase
MTTSLFNTTLTHSHAEEPGYLRSDKAMKTRGRSFYFASKFLNSETSQKAARLYQFCRTIDDIADQFDSKKRAQDELNLTIAELNGEAPPSDYTSDLYLLADETGLDLRAAVELVKGCRSDLFGEVAIDDVEGLIRYCYQVAGTVGIMMCSVLGVSNPRAFPYAVDLGIAMQITNIIRDITEDAESGRRYLPSTLVGNLSCDEITAPTQKTLATISTAVKSLADLADSYYASGQAGICFLPRSAQQSIAIAATIYRQIGVKVRNNTAESLAHRVVIPRTEKFFLAGRALYRNFFDRKSFQPPVHNSSLHKPICHRPGTNPLS